MHSGFRASGLGFRGLGSKQGFRFCFGVHGLGLVLGRLIGFRFWVWGLSFRV